MVSLTVCRDWAVRWEEGPGLLEIWRQDDRCDNSITVGHLSSDTCGSGEQLTAVWDERRWRRRSVGACKVTPLRCGQEQDIRAKPEQLGANPASIWSKI